MTLAEEGPDEENKAANDRRLRLRDSSAAGFFRRPGRASDVTDVAASIVRPLTSAYAELLRRQGNAASHFVRWTQTTGRAPGFVWLGPTISRETVLFRDEPYRVRVDQALFSALDKMRATVTLNPYERELLLGYPYVIGRRDGEPIRAPVLLMPVKLEGQGGEIEVHSADEVVRFNSLPFRTDRDTEARELAIRRVIDATPTFPFDEAALSAFIEILIHALSIGRGGARLDGTLGVAPAMPTSGEGLRLVDQAALFIASKTAYFLVSDLTRIGERGAAGLDGSCLGGLLARAGDMPQVDISTEELDRRRIYYPFPSNRSQRRVAVLTEDSTTRLIRVEGPPGTGKSLTIANLACHLSATGKTVLITSQKNKALEVVDEKLRELGLPELPMTLLRQDQNSKKDLLDRLARIKKERAKDEVEREAATVSETFSTTAAAYVTDAAAYNNAMMWEEELERAHRRFMTSGGIRSLIRRAQFLYVRRKAQRLAPHGTDEISQAANERRETLRILALKALQVGREFAVASASRQVRQGLRELGKLLQRNPTSAKNISVFDRLKADPERAAMLLRLLPVWILAPEDVARLFPCQPGLFDVVIVDEASQVDLPSITPIIYRGKKTVIFGDTKQMQPRRFAFVNTNVLNQAWHQAGLDALDPERHLHPAEQSLLALSNIRAEEENLLDEHFRSLPPIIEFSNHLWYGDELRIMTDVRHKTFGHPEQPIAELHAVADGKISNGSQENLAEAQAVVTYLRKLVTSEDYSSATIGVIALFEEQAALLQELVAQQIPEDEWEEHDLVVVTPDGFQGDERDVILYSLSWDNDLMPRQALSQRQRNHPHEQGMLNVAFTRARDEIHVFHSAPIETFTLADGRAGALTEWLKHCAAVQHRARPMPAGSRLGQVDSEFEAEVAAALRNRGLFVLHQYPACGFHIDLVCEREGTRVAVECDGERYHLDEHGQPRLEDLEREAILRRAGWRVVRIPYRKWLKAREDSVAGVFAALDELAAESRLGTGADPSPPAATVQAQMPELSANVQVINVTSSEEALLRALRDGLTDEEQILRRARDLIGRHALTQRLRHNLLTDLQRLRTRGLVATEDHEYFPTAEGRHSELRVSSSRDFQRGRRYRRRWR
jgi:very-short-patch-repair endonuclease